MIKALPTTYNGVQFKSRTEARWAAYFDLMDVEWRYEDEAYLLPSGGYLPDFYLPLHDCYAEVKGDDGFDLVAMRKVYELSNLTKRKVLLLDGPPAHTTYLLAYAFDGYVEEDGTEVVIHEAYGEVCGDADGGEIGICADYVPLSDCKDRFRQGGWWTDFAGTTVGYGRKWKRASATERKCLWRDGFSIKVRAAQNATTTYTGQLVVRRRAS